MGTFVFWVIMAVIVTLVAKSKGRDGFPWFFYGLLLWPIALVHALVLKPESTGRKSLDPRIEHNDAEASPPEACRKCGHVQYSHLRICKSCRYDKELDPERIYSDERECPACAELIKKKARLCKHCGSEVEPIPEYTPPPPPEPESLGNDALDARAKLAAMAKTNTES